MEFKSRATKELYNGNPTSAARRLVPANLRQRALDKLTLVDAAATLADLAAPPSNRLEALKGDRKGQHSIRINNQYRICFRWTQSGAVDVEIVDYH
jgi:proteic killer suppression protein